MNALMSFFQNLLKSTGRLTQRDIYRASALLAMLIYLYMTDSSGFGVVTYMICIMFVISLVAHFVRRIIFPYLDMNVIACKAGETSMGAAVVFAGICFIIGSLILATSGLLQ